MIANYNVLHSREVSGKGVHLDIWYLQQIGSPAIPALIMYSQYRDIDQSLIVGQKYDILGNMKFQLHRNVDDWRRWTYSEERLLKSLENTQNVQDNPYR